MVKKILFGFLFLQAGALCAQTSTTVGVGQGGAGVVDVIRKESAPPGSTNSECMLLERMHREGKRLTKETRDAVARASADERVNFLRARGDASRKGLYGFKKDPLAAHNFYQAAAKKKSMEAGYNAALGIYLRAKGRPAPADAKQILFLLQFSSPVNYNVSGTVFGQPTYLAGVMHEKGWSGTSNQKAAFLHYRASARNQYVPGVASYLRMLKEALPRLLEEERTKVLAEMRLMANRWKWMSPNIMAITGDLYAEGWMEDTKDGFNAMLHWGIAGRMGWDGSANSSQAHPAAGSIDRQRLERAIEAAVKNRDLSSIRRGQPLEYIDLCT